MTGNAHVLVKLTAGESALTFMRFVPGQAVSPITVGFDGQWRIGAPGVARVHVSLLFDGQQLFVAASSPDVQAYINGTKIDGRWWQLQAPAELRFGQACLRVIHDTPQARPAPGPGADESPGGSAGRTALDGAARWEAQHRSEPPQDAGGKTRLYDPTAARAPAARIPGAAPIVALGPSSPPVAHHAPAPVAHQAPAPAAHHAPAPAAHHAPPVASPPIVHPTPVIVAAPVEEPPMASTMRRPLAPTGDAHAPPAQANVPQIHMPPAAAPVASRAPAPAHAPAPAQALPYPPAPAHAPAPVAGYPPAPAPYHNAPGADATVLHRPPTGSTPGGATRPSGGSISDYESSLAKPAGGLIAAWRSASLVKKITAFLLPLAFAALLLPEPEPPPKPAASARSAASGAGSNRPAATAAPTTGALAKSPSTASSPPTTPPPGASVTPSPPSEAKPAPEARPAPPPGASSSDVALARATDPIERAAIDAAFSGRWQEAVMFYDRLAVARPDEPAFREAARIIRESKLRPH